MMDRSATSSGRSSVTYRELRGRPEEETRRGPGAKFVGDTLLFPTHSQWLYKPPSNRPSRHPSRLSVRPAFQWPPSPRSSCRPPPPRCAPTPRSRRRPCQRPARPRTASRPWRPRPPPRRAARSRPRANARPCHSAPSPSRPRARCARSPPSPTRPSLPSGVQLRTAPRPPRPPSSPVSLRPSN